MMDGLMSCRASRWHQRNSGLEVVEEALEGVRD